MILIWERRANSPKQYDTKVRHTRPDKAYKNRPARGTESIRSSIASRIVGVFVECLLYVEKTMDVLSIMRRPCLGEKTAGKGNSAFMARSKWARVSPPN